MFLLDNFALLLLVFGYLFCCVKWGFYCFYLEGYVAKGAGHLSLGGAVYIYYHRRKERDRERGCVRESGFGNCCFSDFRRLCLGFSLFALVCSVAAVLLYLSLLVKLCLGLLYTLVLQKYSLVLALIGACMVMRWSPHTSYFHFSCCFWSGACYVKTAS
ncbi:uncharacterized protein LOC131335716 [Rhododendron vialii]|uniref:uncharacterized protein LOC131335716 n=1 Tax=Rhododendron vialii TaxID=182163 RepID=UPI00265DF9DC|nr:uncharacterized protein LOC131335716 [Rhododendron vialii]